MNSSRKGFHDWASTLAAFVAIFAFVTGVSSLGLLSREGNNDKRPAEARPDLEVGLEGTEGSVLAETLDETAAVSDDGTADAAGLSSGAVPVLGLGEFVPYSDVELAVVGLEPLTTSVASEVKPLSFIASVPFATPRAGMRLVKIWYSVRNTSSSVDGVMPYSLVDSSGALVIDAEDSAYLTGRYQAYVDTAGTGDHLCSARVARVYPGRTVTCAYVSEVPMDLEAVFVRIGPGWDMEQRAEALVRLDLRDLE